MLRIESPFSLILAGATKSGKSRWLLDLLTADKAQQIFQQPIDQIIFVYSTWQAQYQTLADLYPGKCDFFLSTPWERIEQLTGEQQTLLIVDDKMNSKG